jgi:histidinol-phosphatase (PHP family)
MGFRSKTDVKILAKDAIKAIKKADMTIELSSAGYRKPIKELYPDPNLIEIISEYDIPITFASDAHHPKQVGFRSDDLEKFAKDFGYSKCAIFRGRDRQMIKF